MIEKIFGAAALPLKGFMQIYSVVKNWGFFWAVLQNWGELKRMSQRLAEIVKALKITGSVSCEDSKEMMAMLRFLFEKKIVDFPDVDEAAVAQALREIEHKWVCSIEEKSGAKNER